MVFGLDKIINTPVGYVGVKDHEGTEITQAYCKEHGLSYKLVFNRISKGWTVAKAISTPTRPKKPNGLGPLALKKAAQAPKPPFRFRPSKCAK